MTWLLYIILPSFDRIAGGGWHIPGQKLLRRIGMPLAIFIFYPSWQMAVSMILLGIVLSFDLDEIELKQWDDVFNHGMAMSFCLYQQAGILGGIVGLWWLIGVLWSNVGLKVFKTADPVFNKTGRRWIYDLGKLDWKYVEIGRGVAMAIALNIGGIQ